MKRYWLLFGFVLCVSLLFAQNRANYDTREYEPVKLKAYKTHPKATLPEEVELEPETEPTKKTSEGISKPQITINNEPKIDIKPEPVIDNSSSTQEKVAVDAKAHQEKIEKEEPKNPFTFLPKGKSKAFKITPVEGVTISAEENALDKDREFTMKALDEKQIEDYSNKLNTEKKETGCVVAAWELHAGMSDDEMLEDSFNVEFDLEKLGVLPDFYKNVACFRVDDKGNWFEYVIQRVGKKAWVASHQNSMMVLAVKDSVTIAYDPKDDEIKLVTDTKDKSFSHLNDLYKVFNKYTKAVVWEIKYDEADWKFGKESDGIVEFSPIAIKELTEELNRLYKLTKTSAEVFRNMTADYGNNSYIGGSRDIIMRQLKEKYTQEALKNNPNFREKAKKLVKLYKDYEKIAKKVQSCCQIACDYFYDVIYEDKERNKKNCGLKQVTYKVEIRILNREEKGAETPTRFWGVTPVIKISYGAIKENTQSVYDNFILTVAHEMFHVVQKTCYSKYRNNMKWDEATSQYFEDDALEWFKKNGKMSENASNIDHNADYLEYFTIPFDSEMGYIEGKFYSYSSDKKAALGYPLSHFLRYVNIKKLKTEGKYKDKRWHDFNSCYSWNQSYPNFTTLLYKTFDFKAKEASEYYIDFAKDYSEKFYERIRMDRETNIDTDFSHAPYLLTGAKEIGKNGQRVELANEYYTIRVREIYSYATKKYFDDINRKVALQIVFDSDFKQVLPDRDFKPLGPEKSSETKRGFYYFPINPMEIKAVNKKNHVTKGDYIAKYFYLLEIDSGSSEESGKSGYTIWTMYAPELKENPLDFEAVEEIVNGEEKYIEKVCLQLPPKSEAAEKGKCIDGYYVEITLEKGGKIIKYFEMDKIKDQKVYFDFEELKPKDFKEGDPVKGKVFIAEYLLDNKGEKLNGPESEKVNFCLETKKFIGFFKWWNFFGTMDVIPEAKAMWKGNHIIIDVPKCTIKNGNFFDEVELGELHCELIFDENDKDNNTDTDILKKANFVKKPDKWVIKWNYKDKEGYLVKEEVNIYFDDKTRLWYYGNDVDLTRRYKVREFGIWFEGHKEKITDYGRYVERRKPVPGKPYSFTTERIKVEKVDQTQYDLDCNLNFSTYLTQKHIDEWKRRH